MWTIHENDLHTFILAQKPRSNSLGDMQVRELINQPARPPTQLNHNSVSNPKHRRKQREQPLAQQQVKGHGRAATDPPCRGHPYFGQPLELACPKRPLCSNRHGNLGR